MVGWSNLPADLSDTAALRRLSDHLPEQAIVVSSDLSRAADTASAIQRTRTRLPHQPLLREINFGAWELRRFAEVEDVARSILMLMGRDAPMVTGAMLPIDGGFLAV